MKLLKFRPGSALQYWNLQVKLIEYKHKSIFKLREKLEKVSQEIEELM